MFVILPSAFEHIASHEHFFDKTLRRFTREGRQDTVFEVWARSLHSGARGRRSKVFSGGTGWEHFPGFLHEAQLFIHTYEFCCPDLRYNYQITASTMQRACLPPADYKAKALPPGSSSRHHHARHPMASCFHAFIWACDRSPDHTTTFAAAAEAACCVWSYQTSTSHRAQTREQQHVMQRA